MAAFLLPLLGAAAGGIGAAGVAAAGGIGSMIGGIGGMLGSAGAFGAAGAGGQAATGGLLGAGGKFGAFQAMSTLGMGLGLAQAFGGGVSTGYAPSEKIQLTKEGERLEKKTFETIKKQREEGLMPANLASIYIGRIKKQEGGRARTARGMLSSATAQRVRTGGGVGAALTEAGSRMESLAAPTQWQVGQQEEEFMNALANLQNIRNLELQTPLLRAQGQFARSGLAQMRGAQQGQALGDVAQYLAMMKYPPYQS